MAKGIYEGFTRTLLCCWLARYKITFYPQAYRKKKANDFI